MSLIEKFKKGELIPVCPEQLGGLPIPRVPAEVDKGCGQAVINGGGKVMGKDGQDLTDNFIKGAEETLKIAQLCGADEFIGASKSPSCGTNQTYDGSFLGTLASGDGATAALFKNAGIKATDVNEIES